MPRPRKPTHINIYTIAWKCELHGDHRVIVAGLDGMALTSAQRVVEMSNADGWPAEMASLSIPLDDALSIFHDEVSDHDDLPF